jgi:LPXTG-motif cell wall-anchored protein
MKKLITGLFLFGVVVLTSLSFPASAQAYGNNTPPSVTPPTVHSGLPNTGGPSMVLLGAALVLIVVGGTVMVARRRTNS